MDFFADEAIKDSHIDLVRAKEEKEAQKLIEDAKLLEELGCFSTSGLYHDIW